MYKPNHTKVWHLNMQIYQELKEQMELQDPGSLTSGCHCAQLRSISEADFVHFLRFSHSFLGLSVSTMDKLVDNFQPARSALHCLTELVALSFEIEQPHILSGTQRRVASRTLLKHTLVLLVESQTLPRMDTYWWLGSNKAENNEHSLVSRELNSVNIY